MAEIILKHPIVSLLSVSLIAGLSYKSQAARDPFYNTKEVVYP